MSSFHFAAPLHRGHPFAYTPRHPIPTERYCAAKVVTMKKKAKYRSALAPIYRSPSMYNLRRPRRALTAREYLSSFVLGTPIGMIAANAKPCQWGECTVATYLLWPNWRKAVTKPRIFPMRQYHEKALANLFKTYRLLQDGYAVKQSGRGAEQLDGKLKRDFFFCYFQHDLEGTILWGQSRSQIKIAPMEGKHRPRSKAACLISRMYSFYLIDW